MTGAGRNEHAETEQFLRDQYGSGIANVERLAAGGWSQAFSFERAGSKYVIRWSELAANFERDAFAATFGSDRLPIPEILEIGRQGDTCFAISPFVAGGYLEDLSEGQLADTLPSILAMFRALRDVDLSNTTGYGIWNRDGDGGYPSWKAFLLDDKNESPGSLIRGWRASLERSPLGTETYDRLWDEFAKLVEQCPEEKRLVHSDLLNRNVLVGDGKIRAVLDWGSSLYGDPLYDVAWFMFYEPWYPHFQELDLARRVLDDYLSHTATNESDIESRLLCYQLHIGLDSIAYNASKRDWVHAQEAADYTVRLAHEAV